MLRPSIIILFFCFAQFLTAQENKAEADSAATYSSYLNQADSLYNIEKYNSARQKYSEALLIRSDDKSVVDKYLFCQRKIGVGCTAFRQKYNACIELGDLCFKNNQLEEAKKCYLYAIEIFPFESIPKEKLKEVNKLLK